MESPLQILPLGGVGRIGMNCMLIGNRDRWVVVDCGIQFAADWEIGAEKKLVDLKAFAEIAPKIEAVVITHGHEDHIDGLPVFLSNGCPSLRPFTKQHRASSRRVSTLGRRPRPPTTRPLRPSVPVRSRLRQSAS